MLNVYWGIPIAPLTEEEMGICTEKLGFRDCKTYLNWVEGNVYVTLADKTYAFSGHEDKVEPIYYKLKALFKENNIHLKEVGIRDVVYCATVRTPINMATFAQKNALSPFTEVKIGDAKVSFDTDGFYVTWRGRIDIEAVKAKALAMIA